MKGRGELLLRLVLLLNNRLHQRIEIHFINLGDIDDLRAR